MAEKVTFHVADTVQVSPHQASCDLGGEAAILNVETGTYYGLDNVGARIWQLLEEPRRIADIRDTIVAEYDVTPDRCEQDLLKLLDDLADAGLVQTTSRSREPAVPPRSSHP